MADGLLLCGDDPNPVHLANPVSRCPFLILVDHAARAIPHRLGDLGVSAADMERHIAYDIGILPTSLQLATALGATLIAQRYSRLVIDCNRTPGHATSIPPVSDGTAIPGNAGLSEADAAARVAGIFEPYHAAIAAELDRRHAAGEPCIVIAMHSFTPVFAGIARPWQAGVLHDRTPAFSLEVARLLRETGLHVGDNEPYRLTDESDYTVPVHAERRGLPYLEFEIRQDLIAEGAGQADWAALLSQVLPAAQGTIDV